VTEEEFNETVRSNFQSLVRAAESILGSEAAAEDAVQKTLIRIWKNIDSFDPTKASMRTLLHVAVKRQALSHLLSRKRRIAAMEGFWGEHITPTNGRPKKDDPRMARLMAALEKLPDKKRALIHKRFFEGKCVQEIAKELSLSKSAAQGRLRHAEGALRRLVKKEPK
jgi:RNA polymerase sigma-70 factor (ECF subfamily)